VPVVALVGYTNAGKSTLFNLLAGARAQVSAQVFMTLDPLVRRASLGERKEVLLVDTVGFIQKLPHGLVAAFRATLEEVVEADLLLHVMDGAAPDLAEREAAVQSVLEEIGAALRPRLDVLNKRDLMPAPRLSALGSARPDAILVSATTGEGLAELGRALAERLELEPRRVRLRFAPADARGIAAVYAAGHVLSHEIEEGEVHIEADIPERFVERYREHRL
jgi:GTP-binding protein HflX